jgi:methyl-accepting chemotaxis protein
MTFDKLSIKQKLVAGTAVLLVVVGLFISVFFPMRQNTAMKKYLVDKASVVAGIIAYSSQAGLSFSDASTVNDTLKSLKTVNDVEFALVLDGQGKSFAEYGSEKAGPLLEEIRNAAEQEKQKTWESKGCLLTMVPVGDNAKLGKVILGISLRALTSDVSTSAYVAGLIGLLIAFMGSLVFSVIASRIVTPIRTLQLAAQKIARGDPNVVVDISSNDEIGRLADSFRELIGYFKDVAAAAEAINKGDLSSKVVVKSDQDVLSKNFLALKGVMDEIGRLIAAVREGRLGVRGKSEEFQGIYRHLIESINRMMDEIVEPIQDASRALEKVAQRDLTARMQGEYQGDYAIMKQALDTAISNLAEGLHQVAATSKHVADASGEISTGSQNLTVGGNEQSAALEEVSRRLDDILKVIQRNSVFAREASNISKEARQSAGKGVESMRRLSEAIDRIKASADETAKIVKTIDEIAFQTNLLSLNAAVEAARAGDTGKGFAIVAGEVRSLAMRSATAAKNTAQMLEESARNALDGVTINREVLKNLGEINEHINKVGQVMLEITATSEEQASGAQHITAAVGRASSVTQQNAAAAQQSSASAQELSAQASAMQKLVLTFRLGNQENTGPMMEQQDSDVWSMIADEQPAEEVPGYTGQ